mmetsp:Transcript_31388/g.76910  ORF Transcript_31388/g.76910 Transcript_31388/m.76910 type:complete len:304 (-) Transcript_31388:34-945(-)
MHLHRLDFSGETSGGKGDNHPGLDDTSLDTTDRDRPNTTNLVHVLEREAKGLVARALGRVNVVQGLEEARSLVPGGKRVTRRGLLEEVVTGPSRRRDDGHLVWLVANLLEVEGHFLLDFLVAVLGPVDGFVVHLVAGNDHLLDTEGVGQEGVLAGLSVLRDTRLKLSRRGGNHENGKIGLRGTGNHVLDKVTVARGVDDSEEVLVGLKLPEGNINGDTTLALGLELIKHPRILERSLAQLVGLLLELLNHTLINTTALVNQMPRGGRLAGVHVTNHHDRNMLLLLAHPCLLPFAHVPLAVVRR